MNHHSTLLGNTLSANKPIATHGTPASSNETTELTDSQALSTPAVVEEKTLDFKQEFELLSEEVLTTTETVNLLPETTVDIAIPSDIVENLTELETIPTEAPLVVNQLPETISPLLLEEVNKSSFDTKQLVADDASTVIETTAIIVNDGHDEKNTSLLDSALINKLPQQSPLEKELHLKEVSSNHASLLVTPAASAEKMPIIGSPLNNNAMLPVNMKELQASTINELFHALSDTKNQSLNTITTEKLIVENIPQANNMTTVPSSEKVVAQAPLTITTPFNKNNWGDVVADKVMWMSSKGIKEAVIQMDPPELGPLSVKISVTADQAHVSFNVNNPSVKEALDQSALRLREMFAEEGLNLTDVDVSDQSQQHQHANPDSEDGTPDYSQDYVAEDHQHQPAETPISSMYLIDSYV